MTLKISEADWKVLQDELERLKLVVRQKDRQIAVLKKCVDDLTAVHHEFEDARAALPASTTVAAVTTVVTVTDADLPPPVKTRGRSKSTETPALKNSQSEKPQPSTTKKKSSSSGSSSSLKKKPSAKEPSPGPGLMLSTTSDSGRGSDAGLGTISESSRENSPFSPAPSTSGSSSSSKKSKGLSKQGFKPLSAIEASPSPKSSPKTSPKSTTSKGSSSSASSSSSSLKKGRSSKSQQSSESSSSSSARRGRSGSSTAAKTSAATKKKRSAAKKKHAQQMSVTLNPASLASVITSEDESSGGSGTSTEPKLLTPKISRGKRGRNLRDKRAKSMSMSHTAGSALASAATTPGGMAAERRRRLMEESDESKKAKLRRIARDNQSGDGGSSSTPKQKKRGQSDAPVPSTVVISPKKPPKIMKQLSVPMKQDGGSESSSPGVSPPITPTTEELEDLDVTSMEIISEDRSIGVDTGPSSMTRSRTETEPSGGAAGAKVAADDDSDDYEMDMNSRPRRRKRAKSRDSRGSTRRDSTLTDDESGSTSAAATSSSGSRDRMSRKAEGKRDSRSRSRSHSKKRSTLSGSRPSGHTRLDTMQFIRQQRKAAEMKRKKKEAALNRSHPFQELNTTLDYRANFGLKIMDLDMNDNVYELPLIWKCLFLHRSDAPFISSTDHSLIEDDAGVLINPKDQDSDLSTESRVYGFYGYSDEEGSSPLSLLKTKKISLKMDLTLDRRLTDGNTKSLCSIIPEGSSKDLIFSMEEKERMEDYPNLNIDFVYDFHFVQELTEYVRANGLKKPEGKLERRDNFFCYRVRRWCDKHTLPYEMAAVAPALKDGEMLLCDDMILIQNEHCCSDQPPSWHQWLKSDEHCNGILKDLIQDSGFIEQRRPMTMAHDSTARSAAPIAQTPRVDGSGMEFFTSVDESSIIDDDDDDEKEKKVLTLEETFEYGMCRNGRNIFGAKKSNFDYSRIRIDALVPSLFRFCGQSPPICNLGRGVRQSLMYTDERNEMPKVTSSGITFFNVERYLTVKAPTAVVCGINLDPVCRGRSFHDVWTLNICFSHPCPSSFSRDLLYKRNSIEIEIIGKQTRSSIMSASSDTPVFDYEELSIKLMNGRNGSRELQIPIRLRSDMSDEAIWTYTVDGNNVEYYPMDYENVHCLTIIKYPDSRVRVLHNEKTVYVDDVAPDDPYSTNLLSTSPSSFLLMGHKTSDEDSPPGKVFNGHIFDFVLYPWAFTDFELKEFTSRCMEHVQRYKVIAAKEDVFGEKYS